MCVRRWSSPLVVTCLAGLLGLAGLAHAAPALVSQLVVEGPVGKRVSAAPADLVVYYGGEQRGQLDTCGCSVKARGSLSRLVRYVEVSRGASPAPSVLVNPGQWLDDPGGFDGALRPDAVEMNRWMARGLAASGWDALNVAAPDLAGLSVLDSAAIRGLPLVSANVRGPGISRWRVVERGGLRVGVTGLTAVEPTLAQAPGYTIGPTTDALAVVRELAPQVDVVVLLAWHAPEAARQIAVAVPQLDVVVDANRHRELVEPFLVGSAVWATSTFEAQRIGELRLDLEGGAVAGAIDRHVDLDPTVAEDPALAKLATEAQAAIDAALRR